MKLEDVEELLTKELKDCGYYDDPMFEMKEAEYLDPSVCETIEDCNIEPD